MLRNFDNLEFIKTSHTDFLDSYGFKIKIKNKNIIYTGDTNTLEPFIPFLHNADELYVDVSKTGGAHIRIDSNINVLKKIKENGTSIFLIHLDDKEYIKYITKNQFFLD